MVGTNTAVAEALTRARAGLMRLYGSRLAGVYLFGSRARGNADLDSDVDLLIVLDRVDDYGAEIELTSHLIASLSLDSGLSLSRVFVSADDWRSRRTPFLDNVRTEALPA